MSDGTFSLTGRSRHPTLPSGLPRWLSRKESTSIADVGSIPGCGEDALEEEMATHSSILAREIPWAEELGGLQSMGLQKSQMWLGDWTAMTTVSSGFSPSLGWVFSLRVCTDLYPAEYLWVLLWRSSEFFSVSFSSPNSDLQTLVTLRFLDCNFFNPGSLLGSAWDNAQGHLISVLSLRDSFLSFPNVQCFESFYSIYSVQFSDRKFFVFLLIHLSQK